MPMTQAERRPTLVIIDGHSLLYRGFYATRPLTTSDGRPTNAVYAFTNMLLSLLEQVEPDAIVVAFDAPAPTFRHEAFIEYKAHRREAPETFRPQVEMTRRLLQAMGIRHSARKASKQTTWSARSPAMPSNTATTRLSSQATATNCN
jgi:5'-3' exonuclease